MSERIEVEGNRPEWNYTDMTIFNTQPTCGELSCDQCNERYAKAVARIKALEEVVRELVKNGDDVSSIFGKSRFQAQSDIDAWRLSVRKALELLNKNGGK